jgi:hypothetical protein
VIAKVVEHNIVLTSPGGNEEWNQELSDIVPVSWLQDSAVRDRTALQRQS